VAKDIAVNEHLQLVIRHCRQLINGLMLLRMLHMRACSLPVPEYLSLPQVNDRITGEIPPGVVF